MEQKYEIMKNIGHHTISDVTKKYCRQERCSCVIVEVFNGVKNIDALGAIAQYESAFPFATIIFLKLYSVIILSLLEILPIFFQSCLLQICCM